MDAKTKKPRGRPFAKGHDARRNAGGRPRIPDDAKVALAGLWPFAIDKLKRILTTGDDAASLKAIQIILDRSLGTASEDGALDLIARATIATDELEDVPSWSISYKRIPDDDLKARARQATEAAIEEIAQREASA